MRVLISICFISLLLSCCKDPAFDLYTLRIYTENTHRYVPAQFETITEQVLLKDAYHEGATFETVTEQVLVKQSYHTYRISSQKDIQLVTNTETYEINTLPCITFYPLEDFEEAEFPNIYETRSYQKLAQDGNGPYHEASYGFREFKLVSEPARIEDIGLSQRAYIDYEFYISSEMTIDSFIQKQLALQEITDCLLERSYQVL